MRLHQGDCLEVLKRLPDNSAQTCVTSPPYWGLRDYGVNGQLGLEKSPQEYVENLVNVFREVRRVLKDDGTLWLNIGDSYGHGTRAKRKKATTGIDSDERHRAQGGRHGGQAKQLTGIPWRVAFALQADGWYLRQDIIWHKPNLMPESVRDRCTKAHEYIFLLSKSPKYYFDHEAIKERAKEGTKPAGNRPGYINKGRIGESGWSWDPSRSIPEFRNRRSVWTVTTKPFKGAHFATFPQDLIEPCVLAGSPIGGVVLDPFNGAGTTGMAALKHGRDYIGIELNPEYLEIASKRIFSAFPEFKKEYAGASE